VESDKSTGWAELFESVLPPPEQMERTRKLFESVLPPPEQMEWTGYAALSALHAALKIALRDPNIQAFAPVRGLVELLCLLVDDTHPPVLTMWKRSSPPSWGHWKARSKGNDRGTVTREENGKSRLPAIFS
jgi:hypothetical protein